MDVRKNGCSETGAENSVKVHKNKTVDHVQTSKPRAKNDSFLRTLMDPKVPVFLQFNEKFKSLNFYQKFFVVIFNKSR